MSSNLQLAPKTFPSRIADLGFTAQLPIDWISHNLPSEDVDFSNPTTLVPLALVCVAIALYSFSHFLGDVGGQVFVFFILTVAASEAAIGLAILVVLFRNRSSINVEDIGTMKG